MRKNILELEDRIARLESKTARPDYASQNMSSLVSTLRSLLGSGFRIEYQLEMTESHGKTYTLFIDPFTGPGEFFSFGRRDRVRGFLATPSLKKKVSSVSRALRKALKMNPDVVIGLDGRLNWPQIKVDKYGQRYYDGGDYRWEIFSYDEDPNR
jgi:hypothetical protein